MGSPTINVSQTTGDTSFATIMNLVRALVNDSQSGISGTPGEGQIVTNVYSISPFVLPFLNSAIRMLYRNLRNNGQPTLIKDNVIIPNLPVVNSPTMGVGQADCSVQTYLSFGGFFDGTQINATPMLPADVLYPERVWERETGSNNPFVPMKQPQFGLPSRFQTPTLAEWEWRNDNIWMVGSTQPRDLRLRYYCSLPTFFGQTLDFDSTYVPILDCTDCVAYLVAVMYARMLGSPGLPDLIAESKEQLFQLKNANTRRSQSVNYQRPPYHESSGCYLGWQ